MSKSNTKAVAKKFREYWTFQRGSEKGEDQQFWNSLLRDILGVADVERHIQYQVPVVVFNAEAQSRRGTQSDFSCTDVPSVQHGQDARFTTPSLAGPCGCLRSSLRSPDLIALRQAHLVSALKQKIIEAAQDILDIRERYLSADPACTLAILYNPETMPPDLVKAHAALDALVDKAYGRSFASDAERVAHLFTLYSNQTTKGA